MRRCTLAGSSSKEKVFGMQSVAFVKTSYPSLGTAIKGRLPTNQLQWLEIRTWRRIQADGY
jgi:hypothetical protein